jgi:hypothetical protein
MSPLNQSRQQMGIVFPGSISDSESPRVLQPGGGQKCLSPAPTPLAGAERWLVARETTGQTLCQVQVPFLADLPETFDSKEPAKNGTWAWHTLLTRRQAFGCRNDGQRTGIWR